MPNRHALGPAMTTKLQLDGPDPSWTVADTLHTHLYF